jgi:hypothetical protein
MKQTAHINLQAACYLAAFLADLPSKGQGQEMDDKLPYNSS